MKTKDEQEKTVLVILRRFHAFGTLADVRVDRLSDMYKVDCRKICKEEGITYYTT